MSQVENEEAKPLSELELYTNALRKHDWFYSYSDDGAVFERGAREFGRLQGLQKTLDAKHAIWNSIAPPHFKVFTAKLREVKIINDGSPTSFAQGKIYGDVGRGLEDGTIVNTSTIAHHERLNNPGRPAGMEGVIQTRNSWYWVESYAE